MNAEKRNMDEVVKVTRVDQREAKEDQQKNGKDEKAKESEVSSKVKNRIWTPTMNRVMKIYVLCWYWNSMMYFIRLLKLTNWTWWSKDTSFLWNAALTTLRVLPATVGTPASPRSSTHWWRRGRWASANFASKPRVPSATKMFGLRSQSSWRVMTASWQNIGLRNILVVI